MKGTVWAKQGESNMSNNLFKVKFRILFPMVLAMILLLIAFVFTVYNIQNKNASSIITKELDSTHQLYDTQLKSDTNMLTAILEVISLNENVMSALAAKDRKLLLEYGEPRFKQLRSEYNITHLYFTGPDRVNISRVHSPERFGDTINRFTTLEAERTKKIFSGLEMGPLGTLTLRVVMPCFSKDRLIGYIELGEETDHIIEKLRGARGVDIYLSVDKKFIKQKDWEAGMTVLGRRSNWEQLPNVVIVSNNQTSFPPELAKYFSAEYQKRSITECSLKKNGRDFRGKFMPIKDVTGKKVGEMIIVSDVTDVIAFGKTYMIIVGLIFLAVGALLFYLFYGYINRVERKLIVTNEELQKTAASLENTLNLMTDANIKLLALLTDVEKTGNVKTRFKNPNLVKCWEVKNCTKKECPSHGAEDLRCWQVAGTHCQGTIQGVFAQKLKNCEQCEVYKHAIPDKITETGEIFNNMMLILENKSKDLEDAKVRIEEYNKTLELKVEERTSQLESAQTKLVQSEKMAAIGQLAGGVAHEINNPLTIILGYAQTIMKETKEGNPLYKPLKSIENAAVRCKKIVSDLLAFSRTEKADKENIDINDAIDQAITLVQAWSKVKDVKVIKTYGRLPHIATNKNQIQQVIVNLCNNAVDAMPEGGTITITTKQVENFIEITVADTGKGMSEEVKHHIFEPFFTTKDVGKGTGLGLSLCHGIITKNNGTIEINSEPGKGTNIIIKLPITEIGS